MDPGDFRGIVWGTTLVVSAIGCAAASGGPRDVPLAAPRLLLAGSVMLAAEAAALVVLRLSEINTFGLMHVAYVGGVTGLPFVACVTLLRRRALRPTRAALALCVLGFLPALAGVWGTFIEPYRLQVEHADVTLDPRRAGTEPLRVGVLADLQCVEVGDPERRAVRTLLDQRPDVILLPGDLFQHGDVAFERELPALRELFRTIGAPGGAFLVVGDVDSEARCRRIVEGSSVRLLADEVVETRVRGRVVRILGTARELSDRSRSCIRSLESAPGDDDVRILLTHHPDPVLDLPRPARIDLVVAGHTHGGQVQIPGFGPPFTLTRVPRRVAAGGLSDLDGRRIFVSRGVGRERGLAPPLRLFCPPDVGLLTLR